MKPLILKLICYAILLPFMQVSLAEPADQEPEQTTSEENLTKTIEPGQQEEIEQKQRQTVDKHPQASQLRAREIGAAFRNFKPSEEISADNAVSFPVDI